jgi:hypothetical protein
LTEIKRHAVSARYLADMFKDNVKHPWLPIQLAPESCDLQLGLTEKVGIMPWPFPCRRHSGVWFNVWTNEPVLIHPTHWRGWR